jgi:hypothetical protein
MTLFLLLVLGHVVIHRPNFSLHASTSVNRADAFSILPTPTPTPGGDTTPPVVELTYPQEGDVVYRKSVVLMSASAMDSSGISRVEFYIDNVLTCTDSLPPYNCLWNVPEQSNATYYIVAKAYDTFLNTAQHGANVKSSTCEYFCL